MTAAGSALLATVVLLALPTQQAALVPLCATPRRGLDTAGACERLRSPLPVAISFHALPDTLALSRPDIEAVLLPAFARGLRVSVRGDSAWAFAHRRGTHAWAEIAVWPERELRAVLLVWRGEEDGTLTKLCEFDGRITARGGSLAALAARLAVEAEAVGRCAMSYDKRVALWQAEPPEEPPTPLGIVLLIVIPSAVLVGVIIWRVFFRRPQPDFWRAATRYPDKAYDWFERREEWVVVDYGAERGPRPDRQEFEGPFLFWVPKLGGRRVVVYGRQDKLKESQQAFLRTHGLDVR